MIIHFLVKPYLLFLETHKLHNHYGHCSDYTVSQRHHSLSDTILSALYHVNPS